MITNPRLINRYLINNSIPILAREPSLRLIISIFKHRVNHREQRTLRKIFEWFMLKWIVYNVYLFVFLVELSCASDEGL